jgi:hypothetical protein
MPILWGGQKDARREKNFGLEEARATHSWTRPRPPQTCQLTAMITGIPDPFTIVRWVFSSWSNKRDHIWMQRMSVPAPIDPGSARTLVSLRATISLKVRFTIRAQ